MNNNEALRERLDALLADKDIATYTIKYTKDKGITVTWTEAVASQNQLLNFAELQNRSERIEEAARKLAEAVVRGYREAGTE